MLERKTDWLRERGKEEGQKTEGRFCGGKEKKKKAVRVIDNQHDKQYKQAHDWHSICRPRKPLTFI